MSINATSNPLWLESPGDGTWDQWPNQKIYVRRIDIYGGDGNGDFLLLDQHGQDAVAGGMRAAGEPQNARDPVIILNGRVAASSFTSVEFNKSYRGLYLEDIPVGAKLAVHIGAE